MKFQNKFDVKLGVKSLNKKYLEVPDGFIWAWMAFDEMVCAISGYENYDGNHIRKIEAWPEWSVNEAARRMRAALLSKNLNAGRYDDEGIKEIPCGLWRSDDFEQWLKQGKIAFHDGKIEDFFVKTEQFYKLMTECLSDLDLPKPQKIVETQEIESKYVPPFVELILKAVKKFDIPNKNPKIEELTKYFVSQVMPGGGTISKNHAKAMATFCRPIEAMKGGNKRIDR